jgi:hypothetical protein
MQIETFIANAPKVELHVHLEGAIPARTLLKLAQKNNIALPVRTLEEVKDWYQFRDFPDFNEKYILISNCIQNSDDIYLIGKEFLEGQAAQHIVHSEVTYTAYTHTKQWRIPMLEQISALMEASRWAEQYLGVSMRLIIDIARETAPHEGTLVAKAAVAGWRRAWWHWGWVVTRLATPLEDLWKPLSLPEKPGCRVSCMLERPLEHLVSAKHWRWATVAHRTWRALFGGCRSGGRIARTANPAGGMPYQQCLSWIGARYVPPSPSAFVCRRICSSL